MTNPMQQNNDDVTGPVRLDTAEQYRTRKPSSSVERKDDHAKRTDPRRSSMQHNFDGRGGSDDRGMEDGDPPRPIPPEPIDWPRSWS